MDRLREGLREYNEKIASGEIERTEVTHNWLTRAGRNPNSLKTAIGAMCFQCFGGTKEELPDPGWKNSIKNCTALDCALHAHRPYQDSDREENDALLLEDVEELDNL